MATIFYDRTNSAGGGTYYDRTNDASTGFGAASGSLAQATTVAPSSVALGYITVTLAAPLYTGPGSILDPTIFTTGSPAVGDTISYPTTNNFAVLSDGTIQCDVNSVSYACLYTAIDGSFTNFAFSVTLDATTHAYAALASATSITVDGVSAGGVAGAASGALITVTASTLDGGAAQSATGDIGTASASPPDGGAASAAFPGDAIASLASVIAVEINGIAVGSAVALGGIDTASSEYPQGTGNEFGRGDASGLLATAQAITVDGKGRAQWGHVQKTTTIWTKVS